MFDTAQALDRLLSASITSDTHGVTRDACRILAESTGASAVAVRSVTPDGFAHYEGGWASTSLLDGVQKPLQIRDIAMLDRPRLTSRLEEMPIVPESRSDVQEWQHRSPVNPQVLFCPIRADGAALGYLTLVGSRELPWTDDLVAAVSLASGIIGQYQLRIWGDRVHRRQLALTEFHRDTAASLIGMKATELESAIEASLVDLATVLRADLISLWKVTGEGSARRSFRWYKPGTPGVSESDPAMRTLEGSAFAASDPLRPLVIDGSRISASRAGNGFVIAPGAVLSRPSVFVAVSRSLRWPWQDWEVAAVGAFADLVPMARNARATNERLAATFKDAPLGITVRSYDGTLLDCNQAYLNFLGAESIADLPSEPGMTVAIEQVDPAIAEAIQVLDVKRLMGLELPYRHQTGETVWGRLSVVRSGGPGNEFLLTHVEDITEHREALETIRLRASTDALTGLANRHQTIAAIEILLAHEAPSMAGQDDTVSCAAVVVDLDGFKEVNDNHGHPAGDDVLVEVGRRLSSLGRASDLIGRYGGDEFVVVFSGPITLPDALRQVDRLRAKFDVPFDLRDGTSTRVGASIGVAFARAADTPDELLARADAQMYAAKFQAREQRAQTPNDTESTKTIDLRAVTWQRPTSDQVQSALARDELTFWTQPIIDAVTRAPIGVELLARWPQADGSIVGPSTFVPVMERNGLFVDLGRRALREAAEVLNRWADHPLLGTLAVNVNISPAHLTYGLVDDVQAITAALPPNSRLGLEFIESDLAHRDHQHLRSLEELADQGIRVIIDDFGVGQSSLGRLRSFPATNLKLDKSFLVDIADDPNQLKFFQSVVHLLRSLGYPVTVEGVETDAVYELIKESGAAALQGFLFAKPTPSDQIDDLILAMHDQAERPGRTNRAG